jgi:thiamine pyrophosphate-dependent acetolactate synthase large subunit-like protein
MNASSTTTSRTVVGELAATMHSLGMRHLFTLMGAGNLRLIHHLAEDHGVAVHHFRHENGAVGAADGYARVTGDVGWCTVTQGPGFTNTLTALLTASKGRSPVVLITSDSSEMDPMRFPFAGAVQGLDPAILLEPLGIEVVRAGQATAASDLVGAYTLAREQRRTVVFVLPTGMDLAATEPAREPQIRASSPVVPDPDQTARVAELLRASRHTVIIAGRGVDAAGAKDDVERLGRVLGAHLATTARSVGMFSDNRAHIGIFGGFTPAEAEPILTEADCLLFVGAELNLFQSRKEALLRGRRVIQIDNDPDAFGRWSDPDVRLLGDAGLTVRALTEALGAGSSRPAAIAPARAPFEDVSQPGHIDPRTLCIELDRLLPRPRRLFLDNGHFGAFPVLHMTHDRAGSVVWMPDFGAVGSALAAATASAIATPDFPTVLFIGDCGFYMTMGDLETAIRERIPLIVVCMNDGAAGSELAHMKDWGVPPGQAVFGYADLADAARGMGATAALVEDVLDLPQALAGWSPEMGPLFLDCHISRDVRSPIYDHV